MQVQFFQPKSAILFGKWFLIRFIQILQPLHLFSGEKKLSLFLFTLCLLLSILLLVVQGFAELPLRWCLLPRSRYSSIRSWEVDADCKHFNTTNIPHVAFLVSVHNPTRTLRHVTGFSNKRFAEEIPPLLMCRQMLVQNKHVGQSHTVNTVQHLYLLRTSQTVWSCRVISWNAFACRTPIHCSQMLSFDLI